MKKIKFSNELTTLILSGKKTSTWRLFDDKYLQVGDELIFVNKATGEEFANAVIERMEEKELGKLEDRDYDGHERYETPEAMYKAFGEFYPGKEINEKTLVKIINFKINNFLI